MNLINILLFFKYNLVFRKEDNMNNSYLNNPYNGMSSQTSYPTYDQTQNTNAMYNVGLPIDEQSYIENILRLNRGKKAKFHITVPGSIEWQDRVFEGIIEQSGKDHTIVSNPATGEWYLILMIYLDFVTFDEPINFIKDFT